MSNEEKILELLQAMATRLDRLEEGQASMRTELQAEIKASESRMLAMMESYFEPKFNLLADEMKTIREKISVAEEAGKVETRVDVLESVVRIHSQEIEKLKRAQ